MTRRALLVLLAAAMVTAPAATARADVEWEVVEGLADADADGVVDGARDPEDAGDGRLELRIRLTGEPCPPAGGWTADGEPVPSTSPAACRYLVGPVAEGEHTFALGDGVRFTATVTEHLVASIGDSVASGEGNPDLRADLSRARWLDRPCHRSMHSGHGQAAVAIERGDAASAVAFVPLGCSGATIPKGLRGAYAGIEPDRGRPPAPPQVQRINALAERRGGLDAVLVSVGANDVYFGDIVQFCAEETHCQDRRYDPGTGDRGPGAPTLDEAVSAALERLKGRYAQLEADLSAGIPRDRILIVEYFDPTTGRDGAFCSADLGIGHIRPDETEWAQRRVVRRLNAVVAQAAADHGWRLVEGVDEDFAGHGICRGDDRQRWVRTPAQSFFRQDARPAFASIAGTLHPNRRGHRATERLIRPHLAAVLRTAVPGDETDPPDDEDALFGVRTTTLLIGGGVLALLLLAGGIVFAYRRADPGREEPS